jgi:hypothetical protein
MIFGTGEPPDLRLPPFPKTLKRAVKDYQAWMKDIKKPLTHENFNEIKRRIVIMAVEAIDKDLVREV